MGCLYVFDRVKGIAEREFASAQTRLFEFILSNQIDHVNSCIKIRLHYQT